MTIKRFTQDYNTFGLQIEDYVNKTFGEVLRIEPFYNSLILFE